MADNTSWFDTAVAELADPQNQRVWSIIVSLFGDLAQERGAQISGSALTRIIEPMGIKPEAVRVALHRLRKDSWIESTRSGRASMHFLTDFGRRQSALVTPRIYARVPDISPTWHLLIAEDGPASQTLTEVMLTRPYTVLGRNAALGAGPPPDDCDDLVGFDVSARSVPDWLQARIFPPDLTQACDSLRDAMRRVRGSGPAEGQLNPLQIATLRTLIIHRWRRVVLRHPDLPAVFFPDDWSGEECRAEIFQLLALLPRPDPDLVNRTA